MATDTRKVGIGLLLLVASTAIIIGTGQLGSAYHPVLGSLAALGLAGGSLLVGTSNDARPV